MECVVGIVTSLRAGQFGFRILAGGEEFSFLQNVKTGSKPQTEDYSVGTGVLSQGWIGRGREVDHSLPSIVEVICDYN